MPIAQVAKPVWNDTSITWVKVANATGYRMYFTVGDIITSEELEVGDIDTYDMSVTIQIVLAYYPGLALRMSIQGMGDIDGPYSEMSDAFAGGTPLPQVSQPSWAKKVISWKDVANAGSYTVRLYNAAGECLDTQVGILPGVQRYDYTDLIENYMPAGSYYATVQAMPEVT